MNETYVMLPAAGSLTDFFTAISTLAHEYQAAGNAVLIGIALLILGTKFLVGDDESKARGRGEKKVCQYKLHTFLKENGFFKNNICCDCNWHGNKHWVCSWNCSGCNRYYKNNFSSTYGKKNFVYVWKRMRNHRRIMWNLFFYKNVC